MLKKSLLFFGVWENLIFCFLYLLTFSTMVNGTVLNFGKRYEDDLWVSFDQWSELHLGLDALSNQKFLKGICDVHCSRC